MNDADTHLSGPDLEALAAGQTPGATNAAGHLANCKRCADAVAAMRAENQLFAAELTQEKDMTSAAISLRSRQAAQSYKPFVMYVVAASIMLACALALIWNSKTSRENADPKAVAEQQKDTPPVVKEDDKPEDVKDSLYDGKTVEQWLAILKKNPQDFAAQTAVSKFDSKALPKLLHFLSQPENRKSDAAGVLNFLINIDETGIALLKARLNDDAGEIRKAAALLLASAFRNDQKRLAEIQPLVAAALSDGQKEVFGIHVFLENGQPRYRFHEVAVSASELATKLAILARANNDKLSIRVSYDGDVSWKDVMRVSSACGNAKIADCEIVPRYVKKSTVTDDATDITVPPDVLTKADVTADKKVDPLKGVIGGDGEAPPPVLTKPEAPRNGEAVYEGKTAKQWAEQLRAGAGDTKAAHALAEIGRDALPAVLELLRNPGGSNAVADSKAQNEALVRETLKKMQLEKGDLTQFVAMLKDEQFEVRRGSVELLGTLADQQGLSAEIVAALNQALKDRDKAVVEAARNQLARVSEKNQPSDFFRKAKQALGQGDFDRAIDLANLAARLEEGEQDSDLAKAMENIKEMAMAEKKKAAEDRDKAVVEAARNQLAKVSTLDELNAMAKKHFDAAAAAQDEAAKFTLDHPANRSKAEAELIAAKKKAEEDRQLVEARQAKIRDLQKALDLATAELNAAQQNGDQKEIDIAKARLEKLSADLKAVAPNEHKQQTEKAGERQDFGPMGPGGGPGPKAKRDVGEKSDF